MPERAEERVADEVADGSIHGLVLRADLRDELGLGGSYVGFRPGYLWTPYQGEKPSTLTSG